MDRLPALVLFLSVTGSGPETLKPIDDHKLKFSATGRPVRPSWLFSRLYSWACISFLSYSF